MRSEMILTHLRCNQRCGYCTARRPDDDPAFIAARAVAARVSAALRDGAHELVFSGGEPTMRRDLEDLVAHARRAGAARVVVETNATLIDVARARSLRAAGVDLARVNLTRWGDDLDAITLDPGGFARTLDGLRALLAAGVTVELSAVAVTTTLAQLAALPDALAEALGASFRDIALLWVRTPVTSPDASLLASFADAAVAIAALDAAARRVGLTVKVAPDSGPPPCVFPQTGRVAQLFAMTAGARPRADHTFLAACDGCLMRGACVGVARAQIDRFGAPPMAPVTEDRVRRRLSLISTTEAQVRRELSTPNRHVDTATGLEEMEQLVRVNFHCNQSCAFCFVSTHLPPAADELVRAEIVAAARAGRSVTITGGEPTLNPRLDAYVSLARDEGAPRVVVQTNATRLDAPGRARALADAGMQMAQVSLHATRAELSDEITEAPGTFARTVAGLDALHALGDVALRINFVITRKNLAELVPMVHLVASRWPRAALDVSFVAASNDVVPRETWLVPRYADALPHLRAALATSRALGVVVGNLQSMCGVPLCLVPDDERPDALALGTLPDGGGDGEFTYPPACQSCSLKGRCHGLRRGYMALYGADELRAV